MICLCVSGVCVLVVCWLHIYFIQPSEHPDTSWFHHRSVYRHMSTFGTHVPGSETAHHHLPLPYMVHHLPCRLYSHVYYAIYERRLHRNKANHDFPYYRDHVKLLRHNHGFSVYFSCSHLLTDILWSPPVAKTTVTVSVWPRGPGRKKSIYYNINADCFAHYILHSIYNNVRLFDK